MELCEADAPTSAARRQIHDSARRADRQSAYWEYVLQRVSVAGGATGFRSGEARRPALGSVVSRLRPGAKDVPTYVSIENKYDWERAYYAGAEHEPVRIGGSSPKEAVENLGLQHDLTALRLDDRHSLLQNLDAVRRELELSEAARGIDRFQRKALDIVTSSKVREAFDLDKEPKENHLRYGTGYPHGAPAETLVPFGSPFD